jgi:hypothetical protein
MATEPRQLRNVNRWRFVGLLFVLFGLNAIVQGVVLPGIIDIIGGLMLLPVVNRYIVHVPVPVGGAVVAIGVLMGGQLA